MDNKRKKGEIQGRLDVAMNSWSINVSHKHKNTKEFHNGEANDFRT